MPTCSAKWSLRQFSDLDSIELSLDNPVILVKLVKLEATELTFCISDGAELFRASFEIFFIVLAVRRACAVGDSAMSSSEMKSGCDQACRNHGQRV